MLDVRLFNAPTKGVSLEKSQIGKLVAQSVRFTESLYDIGSFSMTLSGYEDFAEQLSQGRLLSVKGDNVYLWGVIRGISDDNTGSAINLVRTGEDLKSYLKQRICLYPKGSDIEGFDTVKGSTETVLKHYVNNNAVTPANSLRKFERLVIAEDKGRGIADDKYMARFNKLDELLKEISMAQELGFSIDIDDVTGSMIFDVIQGTDRTAGQDIVPRILFDVNLHTAQNSRYISDMESYRNVFYTTKSGAKSEADATTLEYFRDNAPSSGVNRFETQISVNVDSTATDITAEMKNLATKEMTNFEKENTFVIELNSNYIYNKDYFLGDFVTIQDRFMDIYENVQLISVTHEWQGIGYRITGTFGKPRKTNIQLLERQIKTEGGR